MQGKQKIVNVIFISTILLLLVTACAELDSHSDISRFTQSETSYKGSLRWGEWMGAIKLYRLKPGSNSDSTDIKPPTEEYLNHLETIKVKHIEALSSGINADKETGESLFLIEYLLDNSIKIHKIRHRVSWWHDKENNVWFTNTPLPKEFDLPKSRTIKLSPKNN